jgi:hypothetical protein
MGNKPELISRLIEADPSETWMQDIPEASGTNAANQTTLSLNADQRKIEFVVDEKKSLRNAS